MKQHRRSLHDTMWNTDAHASYSKRQEKASTRVYLNFGAQDRGKKRRFRLRHSAEGFKNRTMNPTGFRGFPRRHPSTIWRNMSSPRWSLRWTRFWTRVTTS